MVSDKRCVHGEMWSHPSQFKAPEMDCWQHLGAQALAEALNVDIANEPSKACRAPLVVGPSNSGKTTLLGGFDALFGYTAFVFSTLFMGPAFLIAALPGRSGF